MKVAVIGAGIFGCTAAIKLAEAGHDVTIFEKGNSIFSGATSKNQFRLHEGYHYPRSQSTVDECSKGMFTFTRDYNDAIVHGESRVYAIAKGSKTSADKYVEFCKKNELRFEQFPKVHSNIVTNVQVAGYVDEDYLDIRKLMEIVCDKLGELGVQVVKNNHHTPAAFDHYVVAAYANTETVLRQFGLQSKHRFVYEVVEKPVIRMPESFGRHSVVIMDGPFGCVDPLAGTDFHLMGHVDHAIHARVWTAIEAETIRDIAERHGASHFQRMRRDLVNYIPALEESEYITSMYVVRAILDGKDKTDERPTIVSQLSDNVTQIFSGKIPCCVDAAEEVVPILGKKGG